jgi:hypothetical protein
MAAALRYASGEIILANPARKLFNVHEYHQMGEAGILSARDRVELINGGPLTLAEFIRVLVNPMLFS